MKLEELVDEMRIHLDEGSKLTPDAFKQKYGRCPVGFHTDPDTRRCATIASLQKKGLSVSITHGPKAQGTSSAPKSAKLTLPGASPAAKAVATAAPVERPEKEHSLLKKALHGVWHVVSDPFKKMWKLATDKSYRKEVKDFVIKAVKKEGSQTKVMAGTFKRILQGEKVSRDEKVAALNQFIDLAKVATVGGFAKHMAAGGVMKFLSTMASPVDEVVGVAVDKPLRKLTKKLFGHAHGILPSSFYEDVTLIEAYQEGDEYKLIEKMMDALMDEMGKADLGDDDILAALMKGGLRAKKKGLIQKVISKFSKKESVLVQSMYSLLGEAS